MNPREHGIDVITDLGVREADDPYAHAFENFGAARVIVSEPFMLTAVPRIAVWGSTTSFAE